MPRLFKDYEECLSVIITIMKDFNVSHQNRIGLAINVCESLVDDTDKIFRLYTPFKEMLWKIPEAVEMGFDQYMRREIPRIVDMLEYHDANCNGNCKICDDRIRVIDNMHEAIYGERERP